jgi:hypothetical protein
MRNVSDIEVDLLTQVDRCRRARAGSDEHVDSLQRISRLYDERAEAYATRGARLRGVALAVSFVALLASLVYAAVSA